MNKVTIAIAALVCCASLVRAEPITLKAGEPFTKARARLYAEGWHADSMAHAATGEYMGLDRQLVQQGYSEVDYCSVGKSFCVLQYTKRGACLRLHTQGEQIRFMKVARWSNECRERGPDEQGNVLPAEVRYMVQWRSDCENYGQCEGSDSYLFNLKKKYARDPIVMKALRSIENPAEVKPRSQR